MDITTSQSVADREEEGTLVHLRDAAGTRQYHGDEGAKQPVTITVAGTYSHIYRSAMEEQRERNLKRRANTLTGEDLDAQQITVIAKCILAWDGLTAGDKPFPCNATNAAILLDAAPWIREQVEAAMQDHASFFAAS